MMIKVISTNNTEKSFPIKGTNFGELIDELEVGQKFQDLQFLYGGTILSQIAKGTKLQTICQGNQGAIQIQRKQIENSSKIFTPPPIIPSNPIQFNEQNNTQLQNDVWATQAQPTGNEIPTSTPIGSIIQPIINPPQIKQTQQTFGAPGGFVGNSSVFNPIPNPNPPKIVPPPSTFTSPFQQQPGLPIHQNPFMPLPNQPPITIVQQQTASLRKSVQYRHQINDEIKVINDYRVKITDKGNRVELESEKQDMKAVFLEENANEKIQTEIKSQLTKDLYAQDIKLVVKCLVGEQNQSTKVIFKKNLDGVAIQWATGLITLFDFDLAI